MVAGAGDGAAASVIATAAAACAAAAATILHPCNATPRTTTTVASAAQHADALRKLQASLK